MTSHDMVAMTPKESMAIKDLANSWRLGRKKRRAVVNSNNTMTRLAELYLAPAYLTAQAGASSLDLRASILYLIIIFLYLILRYGKHNNGLQNATDRF